VINTIVYAVVYVVSAVVLLAAADWRLAIPLMVWIVS
jgi:ATP-binding cassette subfamily B multidrug efflux pump